jgi:hypothetical protein
VTGEFESLRVRPYVAEPTGEKPPPPLREAPPVLSADQPVAIEWVPDEGAAGAPGARGGRLSRRGRVVLTTGTVTVATLAVVGGAAAMIGALTAGPAPADRVVTDDSPPEQAVLPAGSGSPTADVSAGSPIPSATGSPSTTTAPRPSPSASRTDPARASAGPTVSASGTVSTPSRSASGSPTVAPSPVLRQGDHGAEVKEMQGRLRQTLAYTGEANGDFDAATRDGVARFQVWYGVQGDPKGVYGPNTRKSLEGATTKP